MKLSDLIVYPLPGRIGRTLKVVTAIRGTTVVLVGQDGRLYHTRSNYTLHAGHLTLSTLRALEREKILDRGSVEQHVVTNKKAEAIDRVRRDRAQFLRLARKYGVALTDGQLLCLSRR